MVELDEGNENPPPGPSIWVIRLKANQKVTYAICSERRWDCFVHWDRRNKRSLPCIRNHSLCQGHALQLPRKWLAYVHVLNMNTKKSEIFEMTSSNWDSMKIQVEDVDALRGLRLECSRGNGDNTITKIQVTGHVLGRERLPEPLEIKPVMLDLWRRGGFFVPEANPELDCATPELVV